MPGITLFTESIGDAAIDTAVSAELLRLVGNGDMGPVARVHATAASVAFGRADRNAPAYRDAVAAAEAQGFAAIERLAGGRAAVFHEATLAVSLVLPSDEPRTGIVERFDLVTDITVAALAAVGVEARVGEVPREYCPGAHSVNARGVVKLAGFGQRIVAGAAHVGGVVVVDDGPRVRDVLVPVYSALGLDWDPATVGTVADEGGTSDVEAMAAAVVAAIGDRWELDARPLPDEVVTRAAQAADGFRPGR